MKKILNLQKLKSKHKKKLEMANFVKLQKLKKTILGIDEDKPNDAIGYLISQKKITIQEFDILTELNRLYCLVHNPNIKAMNFNKIPGNEMPDEKYQEYKSKLDTFHKVLQKDYKALINVCVYSELPPNIKKFKIQIQPLFRI